MIKKISRLGTVLLFLLGLVLFVPSVFAQGHQEGHNGGNAGTINRGSGAYGRSSGHRHYYHNGNWNRNGWFGWGVPAPILSNGVLVASLPPGYTTVVVQGNTYFYGENTYFSQMPAGGFSVVTLPIVN
jgi:hypothetical protein